MAPLGPPVPASYAARMPANATTVAFLAATDLDRSAKFLTDVVGLTLLERTPIADTYDAFGTPLRVALVDRAPALPFTVLGWQVDDVEHAVDELAARGATFERFDGMEQDGRAIWRTPGGDRVAWFRDTEGNLLGIFQPA